MASARRRPVLGCSRRYRACDCRCAPSNDNDNNNRSTPSYHSRDHVNPRRTAAQQIAATPAMQLLMLPLLAALGNWAAPQQHHRGATERRDGREIPCGGNNVWRASLTSCPRLPHLPHVTTSLSISTEAHTGVSRRCGRPSRAGLTTHTGRRTEGMGNLKSSIVNGLLSESGGGLS